MMCLFLVRVGSIQVLARRELPSATTRCEATGIRCKRYELILMAKYGYENPGAGKVNKNKRLGQIGNLHRLAIRSHFENHPKPLLGALGRKKLCGGTPLAKRKCSHTIGSVWAPRRHASGTKRQVFSMNRQAPSTMRARQLVSNGC